MTTQGSRLKKIRIALELSQEKMGKEFGLSKQYWSNFENDRDILNNEKLVKLLEYFKVNLNYLICGFGDMFIPDEEELNERAKQLIAQTGGAEVFEMQQAQFDILNTKVDKVLEEIQKHKS